MLPGNTIIRKCSACTKPIEQATISSGNTFGATYWTDGKCKAPMLPDQPWLVMCPHCHSALWIDELKILGERVPWMECSDFLKHAAGYELPTLDDYFAVLAKGMKTPKKERYVRVRAWWAGNDARRYGEPASPIPAREVSNLKALAQMLDESDANDLVTKAEIMRELGRFDDASALLAKLVDGDSSPAVATIKSLADKGDPSVRGICFD